MAPLVELSNIDVKIGSVPILKHVNLQLDGGSSVGVTGKNGAGKTTLLRVIATLLQPTSGSGTVLDVSLGTHDVARIRPRIGLIGHTAALQAELTLTENLELWGRLMGFAASEASASLASVGLARASDRRADACSNGMRRRADLARLLLSEPQLLLLDEATAGLDSDSQDIVRHLVDRTVSAGGAAVLVSHDESALPGEVRRILRLDAGKLVTG